MYVNMSSEVLKAPDHSHSHLSIFIIHKRAMEMATTEKKPHVIFIPFPDQSHIKGMLKLAELLHNKGLQITFINTEFIHERLLESGGPHSLDGSPDFRFEIIPDGVSRSSSEARRTMTNLLLQSLETNFLGRFIDLVTKLPDSPTCIISDGSCRFSQSMLH
ncbi:hypothetical protein Hdeb2414_s0016g00476811 [Helianthus debilis subsp. tardiflorus]